MADDTTTPSEDPTEAIDPTGPAEGGADEVAALRAELDRLKAENARMKKGLHPAPLPPVAPPPAPGVPGTGPALWEGHLNGDPTAPRLKFRGSESEAEAREAYLLHCGITSTDKTVKVSRLADAAAAEPEAEAEGGGEELKPKAAKPKAAKKK